MSHKKPKPATKTAKSTAPKTPAVKAKETTAKKSVTQRTAAVAATPPAAQVPAVVVAPALQAAAVALEVRAQMIRDAAYYHWERRNRAPGHEEEDWAEAEREVDALLRNNGSPQT